MTAQHTLNAIATVTRRWHAQQQFSERHFSAMQALGEIRALCNGQDPNLVLPPKRELTSDEDYAAHQAMAEVRRILDRHDTALRDPLITRGSK